VHGWVRGGACARAKRTLNGMLDGAVVRGGGVWVCGGGGGGACTRGGREGRS
jgi:hypothetical protein